MDKKDPMLVIVIPTKNRVHLLKQAILSITNQSYAHYRIVIINDGSTDSTQDFLDAQKNPCIHVIHHEKSRGVNSARNKAFKTLVDGEWAIPLDDDNIFLPNALSTIAHEIEVAPPHVQVLFFNAIAHTPTGSTSTGRTFDTGEQWHDFTYEEAFVDKKSYGDFRFAYKWTLFPQYLFQEDINGFEGEWSLLIARDGVGIRAIPKTIVSCDVSDDIEHLSNTAARQNPQSFVRAHIRIFNAHKDFLKKHPDIGRERTISLFKLSIRAIHLFGLFYSLWLYFYFTFLILTQRKKSKK
jgi:glycosyltransferase involved in cell wall biosynthesis